MRVLLLFLVVLAADVSALSVENASHTETFSYHLLVFGTSSAAVLDFNNSFSSPFTVKVSTPFRISINDTTHKTYSGALTVNVTDEVRILSNASELYEDFIDSLNISPEIIIGKNQYDNELMFRYSAGVDNGFVRTRFKVGSYPYDAVVVSSVVEGKRKIFVYGNAIEGEIAGLRYLKKHKDDFLYMDYVVFLEDYDGISVYDFLHMPENQKWYNTETEEFRYLVNKSLFGKFDKTLIEVKTNDNVSLRVMNMKPLNSLKYRTNASNVTLPIVMARGLWSNLYAWEDFGEELSDNGRNVYLIEITGGPGQDCATCVNYDFNDLIESYWPAMIATVQTIENGSAVQYVGHSNGARVGISSLEIYSEIGKENAGMYLDGSEWKNASMTAYPVDTYIAMGMPGAFEGANPLADIIELRGETIQRKIETNNHTHLSFEELKILGLTPITYFEDKSDNTISQRLWNDYYYWISSNNDSQPCTDLSLDNALVIQGTALITNDGIVTTKDKEKLYNNINSSNKKHYSFFSTHLGLPNNKRVLVVTKEFLNSKEIYTSYSRNLVNETK